PGHPRRWRHRAVRRHGRGRRRSRREIQTVAPQVRGSVRSPPLVGRLELVLASRSVRAPQPRAGEPARLRFLLLSAAVISVTCAAPAVAQNEPPPAQHDKYSGAPLPPTTEHIVPSPITDRFALRGTFFDSAVTTSLRVDSDRTGQGTLVNAERDLGLRGRVYQGRVEMYIRMRERHRLRVDYFESDRSGNKALTIPINFADQSFRKGDVANTELDLRMFGLTYTYSVLRYERFELGTGLGV